MKEQKNLRFLYIIIPFIVIIFLIVLFAFIIPVKPRALIPEEKILEVKVQPQGKLQHIPNEVIFHFSKPYPGVEGVLIDKDSLPNFITIDPYLPASGKWISENTFEVYFESPPLPDKKYEVKLIRLPLLTEAESIAVQTISFITPEFEILNVVVKSLAKKKAVLSIDFNFSPEMHEITDFIEIFDSRNRRIKIYGIEKEKDQPRTVLITVPIVKAPDQYTVIVKKGLKSDLDVALKNDVRNIVPIGFAAKPLTVRDCKIEESDDGYMVMITITSPVEKKIEIKEENLSRFIRIKPEISFRSATADGNIYIFADFIPEKIYEVTLKLGITSKKGSILQDDYTTEFTIPKRKETFQFVYRGRYFGKTGDWNLPLKIAQICSVKVNITYMQPENVLFWHLEEYGRKQRMHVFGEMITQAKKIPLEKGTKEQILWLNLRDHISEFSHGVYLVEAYGWTEDKKYFSDRISVVISDISLVVKWYDKNIYVWALNSSNLNPENGVEIEVRSRKNFLTGTGITDVSGFCQIPVLKEGRDPYVVFAKKGEEWTYAHTQSLRLAKEAYDVSGETPTIPYLAYVYPERDLYRPGEEVHFGVVLREKYSFNGIALPIRISIRDPQGRNYLSLSGETDKYGLCEFSFPTTPSSPTGKYMLELSAGNRVLYTGHVFVETFVPERMRVEISLPEKFDIYKSFPVTIESEYLFGAPASGEEYRTRISADETEFRCPGYYNYSFGLANLGDVKSNSWRSGELKGRLDQNGKASVRVKVDPDIIFQGPVVLISNVTVTEGGSGRVTSKTIRETVYTRSFYIGLKSSASRVVSGVPVQIKGILLKPDCTVYTGASKLYYKIYRLSYSYSYRYWDDYYWDARVKRIPITIGEPVKAKDGKFSFTFTPQVTYNDYMIEVYDDDHGTVSQIKVAGWGWWYRDEERVESPEVVAIRLSKEEYDVNEEVKVEALLPFDGKILWTVELDTIYYHHYAEVKGEVATWSFTAPRGVSTIYVSALLIRSGGNYLVQRGFGIERVRIRPENLKLGFKVDVPERIRPGDELVINVKGANRFKGTIAVVDEGILQITDFKTPDPYEKILRDLRLEINSAESFGWIIRKFLEKTGGGFMEREKEFPEARFARIVSYWSGIKESSVDGRLTYKLKIPEYNGKLRIMVLGLNEKRFGAAETYVIVKSDVIISPTIPRFMYTKDDFSFPVTLINTTKEQKKTNISIEMKGGKIKGSDKFTIQLKSEEKKTIWLDCEAEDEPGSLNLKIEGVTGTEKYHEDFVIPLYPNVPFITQSKYIAIESNQSISLKDYFENWYPRAHTAHLILSSIPALARLNHVKYAIHYPYGCIEQTSTSTLVLLRLSPLLPVIAPDITKEKYSEMVNHGIRRIIAMQTISGGFSFWPGGGSPYPWSSSYATFVLLEAKNAGFVVPEGVLKAALNYLDALEEKSGFIYYILAKGGILQKKRETVDRLITLAKKEEYDATNALWVAGAIYEAGKTGEAKHLLHKALEKQIPTQRRYRDDFYSPLKLKGLRLYMIENIDPGIAKEQELVIEIADELGARKSYYYTTQELAWTMLSFGLYAERAGESDYNATLKIEGKKIESKKEKGIISWTIKNAAKYNRIDLEIKSKNKLYLNIENTGFSKEEQAFMSFAKGIRLQRNIYNYNGEPISKITQGDLVIMRIAIKGNNYYDNVAVEACIPAGLEIENPRLGRNDLPTWVKGGYDLWHPDYVDIRDDRVIIFGSVRYDTLYYYTLARAVTPGKFFLPPARGVVMYNPDLNAHTDDARFEVRKR